MEIAALHSANWSLVIETISLTRSKFLHLLLKIDAVIRETELNTSNPYSLLQQLSHFSETDVGGTTGAVYSIFFAAAACAFTVRLLLSTLIFDE